MIGNLLVVAHGQPSEPGPAEDELAHLAGQIGLHLPGWTVRSATLASPGALEAALDGLADPLVFPFFMADGWFIRTLLPRRLADAGFAGVPLLCPLGLLSAIPALAEREAVSAAEEALWPPSESTLILAAHGSGRSDRPAAAAGAVARAIASTGRFGTVLTAFIEEPPRMADVLAAAPARSVLLPLFAGRWGHVSEDIPAAVAEAGFAGRVLPPLGLHPEVPAIVAAAVRSRLLLPT